MIHKSPYTAFDAIQALLDAGWSLWEHPHTYIDGPIYTAFLRLEYAEWGLYAEQSEYANGEFYAECDKMATMSHAAVIWMAKQLTRYTPATPKEESDGKS